MKINYVTYQYFPDNRANTFQTFSTIKAFLRKKIEVNLIFPNRKKNTSRDNYFEFYEVEKEFQSICEINPTKHINFINLNKKDNVLKKLIYIFQHFIWSKSTIKKLKLLEKPSDELFFTRSYIIFYLLRKSKNIVIFECHQITKFSKFLINKTLIIKPGNKIIISLSPFIHNLILSLGVPQNRTLQLDNGYEENYFSNLDKSKIRASNGSENEKIFIFGGSLKIIGETKNLEFFIDTFNEYIINRNINNYSLNIYCINNEDYIYLKNFEYSLPLSKKIKINKSIKEREFIKKLVESDIGVIPLPDNFYVNHFSSSLKFSQYVRANLLIIGSNVDANTRLGYNHFLSYSDNKESLIGALDLIKDYDIKNIDNKLFNSLSTDKRVEKILELIN